MARTRVVRGPVYDFVAGAWKDPTPVLPTLSTRHGFGSLVGAGMNPQAGKQDRDLQRFQAKKGPRGTQENMPGGHGAGGGKNPGGIGHFGTSV